MEDSKVIICVKCFSIKKEFTKHYTKGSKKSIFCTMCRRTTDNSRTYSMKDVIDYYRWLRRVKVGRYE